MASRIIFAVVTVFWLTMNLLLWRAQYSGQSSGKDSVPVEVVWDKMLNALDDSSLNIIQNKQRIGVCHWATSVSEEFSKLEEAPTHGIAVKARVRLDGNVTLPGTRRRFRFDFEASLDRKNEWEQFRLRIVQRPVSVEIKSVAAEKIVRVEANDGYGYFIHKFKFSDFQNPTALVDNLIGPLAGEMFYGLNLADSVPIEQSLPAPKWEAFSDVLTIAHEPVRVYRLQTSLMDRYKAVIYVSRAGEILRAELPDGILLLHDRLSTY